MDAESGSRALSAINDLCELLRLALGAAERVEQEVHGPAFEHADLIARDVHRIRRSADVLKGKIEAFVTEEASANFDRGHPLRRNSDRITRT
ncbi:MAG TPA: hypothetical protein VN675_10510 [Burkholderiales bacterium]|nr:hypothetical protein [Burkholderiales bacterium]